MTDNLDTLDVQTSLFIENCLEISKNEVSKVAFKSFNRSDIRPIVRKHEKCPGFLVKITKAALNFRTKTNSTVIRCYKPNFGKKHAKPLKTTKRREKPKVISEFVRLLEDPEHFELLNFTDFQHQFSILAAGLENENVVTIPDFTQNAPPSRQEQVQDFGAIPNDEIESLMREIGVSSSLPQAPSQIRAETIATTAQSSIEPQNASVQPPDGIRRSKRLQNLRPSIPGASEHLQSSVNSHMISAQMRFFEPEVIESPILAPIVEEQVPNENLVQVQLDEVPAEVEMPQIEIPIEEQQPQIEVQIEELQPQAEVPIEGNQPKIEAPIQELQPQVEVPIREHQPQIEVVQPLHRTRRPRRNMGVYTRLPHNTRRTTAHQRVNEWSSAEQNPQHDIHFFTFDDLLLHNDEIIPNAIVSQPEVISEIEPRPLLNSLQNRNFTEAEGQIVIEQLGQQFATPSELPFISETTHTVNHAEATPVFEAFEMPLSIRATQRENTVSSVEGAVTSSGGVQNLVEQSQSTPQIGEQSQGFAQPQVFEQPQIVDVPIEEPQRPPERRPSAANIKDKFHNNRYKTLMELLDLGSEGPFELRELMGQRPKQEVVIVFKNLLYPK